MSAIAGVHPVVEALRAGSAIERVMVAKGAGGARIQEVIDLCRQAGIPVRFEDRGTLDRHSKGAVHQGVVAFSAARAKVDLEDVLPKAKLVVVLDGVEDPHNLGAIARTAHAAGASALIIPERRAAGVTPTAEKAAAGAFSHLPVITVTNVNRALDECRENGLWIYGLDERGEYAYDEQEYNTPTAFVLGGEGHGLHEKVKERCDGLVRIPLAGAIASLNVSVAAGIALFEWKRRCGGR